VSTAYGAVICFDPMSRILGISVDCANTALVARFWAKTLGAEIVPGASRELVVLTVGVEPDVLRLTFRRVPGGKFLRNRVRLDLVTENFEFEAARLLSLGAIRLADVAEGDRRSTTFADVEGNEFDLIDGVSGPRLGIT
jgi:hypothetical protein